MGKILSWMLFSTLVIVLGVGSLILVGSALRSARPVRAAGSPSRLAASLVNISEPLGWPGAIPGQVQPTEPARTPAASSNAARRFWGGQNGGWGMMEPGMMGGYGPDGPGFGEKQVP